MATTTTKPAHGQVTIIGEQFSDYSVQGRLYELARMPHVQHVYGMPDLHMASPCPIGTSIEVSGHVYTRWIGDDIGCGVALYRLKNPSATADPQALGAQLDAKFAAVKVDLAPFKQQFGVSDSSDAYDDSLGTIGGGNHFAEVMKLDKVLDPSFAGTLDPTCLYLCVHTGSRDMGADVQRRQEQKAATTSAVAGAEGADAAVLREGSPALVEFMQEHDKCVRWARCSRRLIAERMCKAAGLQLAEELYDVTHNFVEQRGHTFIHRKGSIPTNSGPAMIPGSRGTASYLVSANASSLHSLPHGAGRTMSRTEAKQAFAELSRADLTTTASGSRVCCDSESLLRQEHPDCYKDIDAIADTLRADYGVNVVARFTPVVTVKM